MLPIRPLPGYLVQRYHGWRATIWDDNQNWYRRLAEDGQRPRAMVIACCDSRVDVASIFGADSGELFIHTEMWRISCRPMRLTGIITAPPLPSNMRWRRCASPI